ncbi:hypothetical protein GCM10010433_27690 [Streptomyces pulveraceus]
MRIQRYVGADAASSTRPPLATATRLPTQWETDHAAVLACLELTEGDHVYVYVRADSMHFKARHARGRFQGTGRTQ